MESLAPRFETGGTILLAGLSGRYSQATGAQIPALWRQCTQPGSL